MRLFSKPTVAVVRAPQANQALAGLASHLAQLVDAEVATVGIGTPDISVTLLRPDDLLNLVVHGYNLRLDTSAPDAPQLVRGDPAKPAYLAFEFPPQSIAEEAFYEVQDASTPRVRPPDPDAGKTTGDPLPYGTRPARAAMSGPSRLVFSVPEGVAIPYTMAGLLDWHTLQPSLNPRAKPPGGEIPLPAVAPARPEPLQTFIEAPFRLLLSPDQNARWQHSPAAITHAGRTELWHTRLIHAHNPSGGELSSSAPAHLRAIWSRDYTKDAARRFQQPDGSSEIINYRTALTPYDRRQIVRLTSDYRLTYVPPAKPARASIFLLRGLRNLMRGSGNGAQAQARQHGTASATGRPTVVRNPQGIQFAKIEVPDAIAPIAVEQLMLSPLGAWLRAHGTWDPLGMRLPDPDEYPQDAQHNDTPAVSDWQHLAAQGRDHYVRVIYEGYLFPFGHRASLIKVTERKFVTAPAKTPLAGAPIAYLRQHMYIVVRQPEMTYDAREFQYQGREMPFKTVRLTTLVTPDILPPEQNTVIQNNNGVFWIKVPSGLFPFHVHATDAWGHAVDFTTGLIFMLASKPEQRGKPAQPVDHASEQLMRAVIVAYDAQPNAIKIALSGQRFTYAEPQPGSDTTTLPTDELLFSAEPAATSAGFLPTMRQATVHLASVEQMLGGSASTTITLYDGYLKGGFGAGGVFAQFAQPVSARFSAEKGGGIATPNMALKGLSRVSGPVAGDLATVAANTFDPKQYFGDTAAYLFGTISLADLVATPTSGLPATEHAPQITTRGLPQGATMPTAFQTSLEWHPPVKSTGALRATPQTKLDLSDTITTTLPGARSASSTGSSFQFSGSLMKFSLAFANIMTIHFDTFRFTAASGRKVEVAVNLDGAKPVTFEGDLQFLNALSEIIPAQGFGDSGPTLDVTPTQAVVGYTLPLPPVEVGVMSLQNAIFDAQLTLPFLDGTPLVEFNFGQRDHRFLVTVEAFAGGGFLHLQLNSKEVLVVEGALEFGGNFALDLEVASGGVHLLGGIYLTKTGTASKLSGFVRCGGELSVLGLISVSLEFNLALTYDAATGKARGSATLTVSVDIAFFSTSVDLTVERSFGGQGADPTFAQVVSPDEWATYAAAFASAA